MIQAPAETKLEVPHPEEVIFFRLITSLYILSWNPSEPYHQLIKPWSWVFITFSQTEFCVFFYKLIIRKQIIWMLSCAQSLQVHLSSTKGPIEVFLCSDQPFPDSCVSDGSHNLSTDGCHSPPQPLAPLFHVHTKGETWDTTPGDYKGRIFDKIHCAILCSVVVSMRANEWEFN